MTLKEAREKGAVLLAQGGIDEAALDAWYLLEYVTGINRARYLLDSDKELDIGLEERYFQLLQQRAGRIPLQHLTGVQEFMGLEFLVNEHVLIPRQDTEILAEAALDILQAESDTYRNGEHRRCVQPGNGFVLLDLCTGSGCILLSILKCAEMTGRFKVKKPSNDLLHTESPGRDLDSNQILICGTGSDISLRALETARSNAGKLGIETEFISSDLFENVKGRFSMIVSNPPYIRSAEIAHLQEEVRRHEPALALDGGEDGLLFYRKIIQESRQHLVPSGHLLFEIGYDQAADVCRLMYEAGFHKIAVKKDLAGLDRVVSGMYDDRIEL